MKKKLFVLLICALLILSALPLTLSANKTFPDTLLGIGNRVVALESDAGLDAIPSAFGTKDGDGLIWTNKTVRVEDEHFEVTLSALAQEYSVLVENKESNSTPSDVVMILDVSGSMRNNKLDLDGDANATRTKAMVKAVNEAMEVIMNANPQNRVMIYIFHTDNDINSLCSELLPLGHYTNPSWTKNGVWSSSSTDAAKGKYFDYSVQTTSDKISTAKGLLKDGEKISGDITTSSGTCTQQGIITGVKGLCDAISNEERTTERLPFVFLFTDGAPGAASKDWYSAVPTDKNRTKHYNDGNAEVTALTILSAALEKDRLAEAYTQYNGKETEVQWFNLGLTVGSNAQGTGFLNPVTVWDGSNNSAKQIVEYIGDYTSGKYSEYSYYAENYVYAKENVYFASTGKELTDAFAVFAEVVKESSKENKAPIVSVSDDSSIPAGIEFKDVIGDGMTIDGVILKKDAETSIEGVGVKENNSVVYSFEGMETTVTVSKNENAQEVLSWYIPAKELSMYTFTEDSQYNAAEPIRLSFGVKIANEDSFENQQLYVSGFEKTKSGEIEALTTVEFAVPKDNPYYYDITTDSDGLFVSSKINESAFDTEDKDENISKTAEYLVKPSYTAKAEKSVVVNHLGNNGTAFAVVELEKTASKDKVNANESLTFTVKITNLHNDKINNVIVTDVLPEGLTFVDYRGEGVAVENNNNTLKITVEKLDENETIDVVYTVKVDATAQTNTVYKNNVSVNSIENTDVLGEASADAEITVENKFKVIYKWDGKIPTNVTLPVDGNVYTTGDGYTVDTVYTSEYVISDYDQYGNKNGEWRFSGWTDKQNGIMGYENAVINGLWTYESITVATHKVIYNWSGDIPDEAMLPKDNALYVKGQSYTLDSEYSADTIINSYDKYGNKNGEWRFSGWNDDNGGIMNDSDVTVTGVWEYASKTVPTNNVLYDWGTKTPDGVELPKDNNEYVKNQPYKIDGEFTAQTVIETFDNYGNKNGEWRFSGWTDENKGVMGNSDITVKGKWTYTEKTVAAHNVFYDWGKDAPNSAVLPYDLNQYVKNQSYEIDSHYNSQSVIDTFDKYGNKNGEWRFSGWNDDNGGIMDDSDVTVKGKWSYTAVTVPAYKVIYSWNGDVPTNTVLPIDNGEYVKGESYAIDQTFTSGFRIETKDEYGNLSGVYTFFGWTDPNNGTMGNSDVMIKGEWKYVTVEIDRYAVTYYWGEKAPEGEKLPVDINTYAQNQPYSADEKYTESTSVYQYDQKGNTTGVWRFSGWTDPQNGVMGNSNVTIVGEWLFTEIEVPKHEVDFDDDIEVIENLDKIKIYPNGGVWQYAGVTYKDYDSAVIVVDGDIEILDPTREHFTYEGWEVLKEDGYKLVLRAKWLPPVPTTGDSSNIVPIAVAGAAALALLVVLAFVLKKKR